jgi:hypothetical protein
VARLALLAMAAAAVISATVLLVGHRRGGRPGRSLYTCPMHPEIASPGPGQCPICRMSLEPKRAGSVAEGQTRLGSHAAPERFSVAPSAQDRLFADVGFVRARPVSRDVSAPAWVESAGVVLAHLYRDEVALLEPGEEGVFVRGAEGGPGTPVRMAEGQPADWDAATLVVRLRAVAGELAVGTVGRVRFAHRVGRMLALPLSAVLQGPAGPYVLVASGDRHTFSKRPIQMGRSRYGYAPVLSGLASGERVAAMETFFIDAERRLALPVAPSAEAAPP